MVSADDFPRLRQRPTGIRGLDTLLRGGLVEGSVYLVLGRPGTGKTTFGNHLAFNTVANGGSALYVTVMAESHDRMLKHLSGFDFLQPEEVGQRIHYLSVYDELVEHGLDGVQSMLRRAIRERGYDLVVIDGAGVLEMAAASELDYSRFVADLSVQMSALGCTTILLAVHSSQPEDHAIAPYVDGILSLEDHSVGLQDIRYLHMTKVRGVAHIRGRHRLTISSRGIDVYPRLESVIDTLASDSGNNKDRVSTGVHGLDAVLHGGLLNGSVTLVSGPAGVGKTILGLQYILTGASEGERCLMATFHESAQALSIVAGGISPQLGPMLDRGQVQIFSATNPELPVDDWAWNLLDMVDEHRPDRILIDGISDVARLRLEPYRLASFYRALTGHLTSRGITTMLTAESSDMFGPGSRTPVTELATISDNVLLMHYVQVVSRMHRILTVFKVRGAAHDHVAREFSVSDRGIELNTDEESAARILTAAFSSAYDRNDAIDSGGGFETTS